MNIYRLRYSDAEGAISERQIEIKSIIRGDNPSNTYIYAFCYLANDIRRFRFDRIKDIYTSAGERIEDPYSVLLNAFEEYKPPESPVYNAADLANEALYDTEKPKHETNKKPEIKDIPTLKKGIIRCYIIAAIFTLLGIISMATIILPILFFGAALAFVFGAREGKKKIKGLGPR